MSITQHLKSKNNVSKREREMLLMLGGRWLTMLFSDAFLNTTKYFLHNKSHKETECVAHKKTPLENKGGDKKLT